MVLTIRWTARPAILPFNSHSETRRPATLLGRLLLLHEPNLLVRLGCGIAEQDGQVSLLQEIPYPGYRIRNTAVIEFPEQSNP